MDSFFFEGEMRKKNLGSVERGVFTTTGLGALGYALLFRSKWSIPLGVIGGALVYQGIRGHSFLYQILDIDRTQGGKGGVATEQAITINRPVAEVFQFWREFENFPRFMKHVKSIQKQSGQRSHWVVEGPLGSSVEWDAEITGERENEFISWSALPNSEIEHHGLVRFKQAPANRGTEVYVALEYYPLGGSTGAAIAALLGEEPDRQIREDLLRLRQLLETGEVATVEGQPVGNRGPLGLIEKVKGK